MRRSDTDLWRGYEVCARPRQWFWRRVSGVVAPASGRVLRRHPAVSRPLACGRASATRFRVCGKGTRRRCWRAALSSWWCWRW